MTLTDPSAPDPPRRTLWAAIWNAWTGEVYSVGQMQRMVVVTRPLAAFVGCGVAAALACAWLLWVVHGQLETIISQLAKR